MKYKDCLSPNLEYPNLAEIGFTDAQLNYILLVYSLDTRLGNIPLPDKKNQAFVISKITHADLEYLETKEGIEKIVHFLRISNSMLSSLLICLHENFWDNTEILMSKLKTEDKDKDIIQAAELKSKLRSQNKLIITEIDEIYNKIFSNDSDLQEKVKRITPETLSQWKQEKKS